MLPSRLLLEKRVVNPSVLVSAPVIETQPVNAREFLGIVCDENAAKRSGMSRNHQIVGPDQSA